MAGLVWLLTTAALTFQIFWVMGAGQWISVDALLMMGVLILSAPLFVGFWFVVMKSASKAFERYA